jgi:hypothetical protein
VIYHTTLITIENASDYFWKLKAIDSIEISNDLTGDERKGLIDSLIENREIKTVLASNNSMFECKSYLCAGQQQQPSQLTQGGY